MSQISEKPKINIDLGAKASLKVNVSTEIPSSSSGRFLDAVTDMFRPFSEKRGLRADQIRLQREDVLLEIAEKAKRRIEIEKIITHPLPNKFLIPFLEKASLEGENDLLRNLWANLFVSATANPNEAHPKYVQILSELTVSEAELLKKIIYNQIDKEPTPQSRRLFLISPQQRVFDTPMTFAQWDLKQILENAVMSMKNKKRDSLIKRIYTYVDGLFGCPCVALIDVTVQDREKNDGIWGCSRDQVGRALYLSDVEVKRSLDIVESLNLIRRHQFSCWVRNLDIDVFFVSLTDMAVDFLISCDGELHDKVCDAKAKHSNHLHP